MAAVIRITGARVARHAARSERLDLTIAGTRILPFDTKAEPATELDLQGHLILPGLINAHDHLEFSLFPRLGNGPYPNATAWAEDIYHRDRSPIREHLRVPKPDRLLWGGIRNLLSGVTTVAHHNPYEPAIFNERFPVRVVRRCGWAHSLAFSSDIEDCRKRTPRSWPFIIHAAEGTDESAQAEIPRMKDAGWLDRRTVLVHAVGTTPAALETIRETGASIVWCPSSNSFTLGQTLTPHVVRSRIPIALGTDSALTGAGDLIDEIRSANLPAEEVYPLVTSGAASVLRLTGGEGTLREHGVADLVIVRDIGQTPARSLFDLLPELVMLRGRIMLLSETLAARHPYSNLRNFHRIRMEDRGSWFIRADVPGLYASASQAVGPEVRLSGKRVCL
jgi:cytosine/adenosine deaminase-related metal-dependent hydrolase